MKKQIIILCSLFILLTNSSFTALNNSWEKAYTNKETVIYTRTTESGIKEFKAITTLDANMKTVLAVIADYKNHPNWMRSIKSSKMVKQVNTKTRYLYYVVDMPWPIWDRDLVSKSTFYTQTDGSVLMKIQAMPKAKATNEDYVRIMNSKGSWKVIPLEKNKTKVIYQYNADPVGISSTLVNMFLLEVPKDTFVGLKKQIKLAKYKNPDLGWLFGK